MKSELTLMQRRMFWTLLIFTMLVRLLSLGSYPLTDTTEARYGEIARLMAETGDWVTPQIHQGVPFWGKPPLSTWLSAVSIRILGVNEFAARLPSFLIALTVLALVYFFASRQRGRDFALVAAVGLASSVLFFVSSGAVMTDPALFLGTTLSMVAFWRAMTEKGRSGLIWGYFFFVGLALGLLAKGPVALVLTGLPVGGWIGWKRQWGSVWCRIPWLTGLALCLVLSVPWYYLAEVKTPGFLDYFLIGEHWKRFLISGWNGDLYGHAHSYPLGTIWLFWLESALPWTLVFFAALCRKEVRRRAGRILNHSDGWCAYLVLWAVSPMVFFTVARNILPTYILPGLPAFALLMTELVLADQSSTQQATFLPTWGSRNMLRAAVVASLLYALGGILVVGHVIPLKKSQKELVTAYQNDRGEFAGQLVYLFKRPHSAEFYSRGRIRFVEQVKDIETYFKNFKKDYFAVKEGQINYLPESFLLRVESLGKFNGYSLLKEKNEL